MQIKPKWTSANLYIEHVILHVFGATTLKQKNKAAKLSLGRGGNSGGLVISMLACSSVNLSLNPAEAYSFFYKMLFEKNKNKQKETGLAHLKKFSLTTSVTSKKSPNVFKSCPKMI